MASCPNAGLRASRRRPPCRDQQPVPLRPAARPRRPAQSRTVSDERRRSGVLYGAGAYIWWGLCPGFFLLLLPAGAPEVLAHRIVWSALFLLLVLAAARRLGDLRRLTLRTWLQLLAASVLIAINWGTYIYAVTTGHVVDAA